MASFAEELKQLRESQKASTSTMTEELKALRKGYGKQETQTVEFAPDRPGWFREFFKPEIGAGETLLSAFNVGEATRLVEKDRRSMENSIQVYRKLKPGPVKDNMKKLMLSYAQHGQSVKFEDIIPTAKKTPSQVFGEAASLGLLVASPTLKGLSKIPWVQRFTAGGTAGALYGASFGLAEEGELKDKYPTIAYMSGIGFLGGGALSATLPPLLASIPRGIKIIFDKVIKPKPTSKVVLPIVREVERQVGKVEVKPAFKPVSGYKPVETQIQKTEQKLAEREDALDNYVSGEVKFLAPRVGRPVSVEVVTEKTIKKTTQQVQRLRNQIKRLEKTRDELYSQSALNNLQAGDEIFSKNTGRVKIRSFLKDENKRLVIIGEDINGRPVTIAPEDLIGMRKIIKPQSSLVREYVNLAPLPTEPVKVGKVQRFWFGAQGWLRTTTPMLESLGTPGKQLARLLSVTIDDTNKLIGKSLVPLRRLVAEFGLDKKATKLTPEEIKNIVDILDQGLELRARSPEELFLKLTITKPINERVEKFVRIAWQITKPLVEAAEKIGIQVRDRATGKKYPIGEPYIHFPHIPKDMDKLKAAYPELAKKLAERKNLTPKQANVLLNQFVKNFATNRFAGLEQRRTLLIQGFDELSRYGYETDPTVALVDFVQGAAKRISEARRLGKENEIAARLIDDIRAFGYDSGIAQEVLDRYRGSREVSITKKDLHTVIRGFQVVTKLPLAAIVNATQVVNTAAEFGTLNLLRGVKKFIFQRVASKEAAQLAGVVDNSIDMAIKMAGGDVPFSSKFLQKVLFTPVEKFNRIITVVTSQRWAEGALSKLVTNPSNNKLRRHLSQLGINVRKAIERGRFTQDELNTIGQKAAQSDQFRGSVLDIPLYWSSPWGKTATQFKSFAWQQGSFIKRVIWDEATQGNFHPLLTYLVLSQMFGETVKDIRSILKADLEFRGDYTVVERLVDNQLSVGGLGLTGDLFERMYRISRGDFWISTADFFAGPTGGDVATLFDSMSKLAGGKPTSIVKFGGRELSIVSLIPQLQQIPLSGAILRVIGDIVANLLTRKD